jgi:hypothetical protein
MADLGIGYVEVLPRTDKFVSTLSASMSKAFGTIQKALGGASGLTTGLTLGFAALGFAATKAISSGISATQEWASEIRGLQRVTGQSAESASGLLAVTGRLGIDSSTAARSFALFAKNVQTNNKALEQYGVDTRDASGALLPFDTILGNTADAVAALPPGLQQAAAAKQLFGRAGVALLPLLQKESTGIEELKQHAEDLGLVMSQQDVDSAKDLTIAQNELHEAMKGASISLGKDFIPAMTVVVNLVEKGVEVFTAIPGPIKDTVLAITLLTGAMAALKVIFGFFSNVWGPLIKSMLSKVAADQAVTVSSGEAGAAMELEGQAALFSASEFEGATAAAEGFAVAAGTVAAVIGAVAFSVTAGVLMVKQKWDQMVATHQAQQDVLNQDLAILQFGTKKEVAALNELANTDIHSLGDLSEWDRDQTITQIGLAQQAIEQFGQAAEDTRPLLTRLFDGLDASTTKLSDVPMAMQAIMDPLTRDFKELSTLSQNTGQDFQSAGQDLLAALQDPALTLDKLPDLFANTVGKLRGVMQGWRDSIVSALGGAGSALDQFADKQNVNINKATQSLQSYTNQVKSMGTDLLAIHQKYGKSANDFIQWATEQGLAQRGLADAVAQAGKKDGKAFVDSFNDGNKASDDFAKTMTHVLGKAFDDLLNDFKAMWNQILEALGRDPIFHIDTGPAQAAVANLKSSLLNLPTSTVFDIKTNVHSAAGGYIPGFASGGSTDTIPAMLSPGEFVMQRSAVERIGAGTLAHMNNGGAIGGSWGKASDVSGELRITDWRHGIASLDAEVAWEDAVRYS